MTRDEILTKTAGILRDIFDDETLVITDETAAKDIEEWDSLEQINILTAMQRVFGVKFSVAEVEELKNVGEMVDLVAAKRQ